MNQNKELLLLQLNIKARGPIGSFLIAYMKQTKKQTIQLPVFVSNIHKAYTMDKFGLKEMIHSTKDDDLTKTTDPLIAELESIVPNEKGALTNKSSNSNKRPATVSTNITRFTKPQPTKYVNKEPSSQNAAYSRHTKSSLAHQRKIPIKSTPSNPEAKKQHVLSPQAARTQQKTETRKTMPAVPISKIQPGENNKNNNQGDEDTEKPIFKQPNEDLKIPSKPPSTEEQEYKKCTFKPSMVKAPPKYQNIRSKLLDHFEASDSISEEAELAYEMKQEMKKRRMVEWQNKSCDGIMNTLLPSNNEEPKTAGTNRPLSPVIVKGIF